MENSLNEIACPRCNAPLKFRMGTAFITCNYCGYVFSVNTLKPLELRHIVLVASIDQVSAAQSYRSWLGRGFTKPQDLPSKAVTVTQELVFEPVWRIPIKGTARYEGTSMRVTATESRSGEIERQYEWNIMGRRQLNFSLPAIIPLEATNYPSISDLPANSKLMHLEIEQDEAVSIAKTQLGDRLKALALEIVDKLSAFDVDFEVGTPTYLHFPLWIFTYRYEGPSYMVVMSAITGEVIKGEYPQRSLF